MARLLHLAHNAVMDTTVHQDLIDNVTAHQVITVLVAKRKCHAQLVSIEMLLVVHLQMIAFLALKVTTVWSRLWNLWHVHRAPSLQSSLAMRKALILLTVHGELSHVLHVLLVTGALTMAWTPQLNAAKEPILRQELIVAHCVKLDTSAQVLPQLQPHMNLIQTSAVATTAWSMTV